jgi:hypothetical protein
VTDLLDELRAANPVDATALDVPDALLRDQRPARGRRVAGLAIGGAIAAAILIAVVPGGSRPGLADRAYAAFTGPGVVHWRSVTVDVVDGKVVHGDRQEGWSRGAVQHIATYHGRGSDAPLESDTRISGRREVTYNPRDRLIFHGPAPTLRTSGGVVFGDPLVAFRLAHRAGELVPAGPSRFRIDPRRVPGTSVGIPGGSLTMTYVLDPHTARPRELTVDAFTPARLRPPFRHHARHERTITRFTVYERLPDTAANRAKLALLPHPPRSTADPAASFAPLRSSRMPSARLQRLADGMAEHPNEFHLDASRARLAGTNVVLIPGQGALCAMVNGGGTCAGLRTVLQHGLAFGGSRIRGMIVVVPDGVRSVRAHLPRHPMETFAVHGNLARLPNGGYLIQRLRR